VRRRAGLADRRPALFQRASACICWRRSAAAQAFAAPTMLASDPKIRVPGGQLQNKLTVFTIRDT
jgi:hypothetical protein